MPREQKPLTKRRIEQATVPPGAWQLTLWDTIVSGFGVRCLPGGSKTFVYRYRPHGGDRRKALSASGKAELDRLLDRVDRVAARIGEPHDLGARALRLQQERSEIGGAERMAYATYHLAAARLDEAGCVSLHRMAEGEIRGQEEPAVAALRHDRLGGAGSNGVGRSNARRPASTLCL